MEIVGGIFFALLVAAYMAKAGWNVDLTQYAFGVMMACIAWMIIKTHFGGDD